VALRLGLEALHKCERLAQAEWRVARFAHDARCKRSDGDGAQFSRRFMCGVYWMDVLLGNEGVADWERLAEEMEVELDEEGFWDFGKRLRLDDGLI